MTYALWTDVLINYESFTRLWGGGFHAWSRERPEEGKGKKNFWRVRVSCSHTGQAPPGLHVKVDGAEACE